jgi:hypothetical protein
MNRFFARTVYLQAALGMASYCVADMNAGLALLGPILCVASWLLVESQTGKPLPRWAVNGAVLMATAWLFGTQMLGGGELISGLGYYILLLQLCKLFEAKISRDWAQLIILSLMQMVCAAILSNQFFFAVLLVIYLPLALITAFLFQLVQGRDDAERAAVRQAPRTSIVWGPWLVTRGGVRQIGCVIFGLSVVAVVGSVFIFSLMPRGRGTGLVRQLSRAGGSSIGYSSRVQLTGNQTLSQNDQTVIRVRFTQDGVDQGKSGKVFRLRGAALDAYDKERSVWVRFQSKTEDRPVLGQRVDLVGARSLGPKLRQEITLLQRFDQSQLFAVFPPVGLEYSGRFKWNSQDQTLRSIGRTTDSTYWVESLTRPDLGQPWASYPKISPVSSRFNFSRYARGPILSGEAGRQLESETRRLLNEAGLARDQSLSETAADHQIARLIETHLQQNYSYTLKLPPIPEDTDPIVAFLFENREGHCQYFASAMCAMVRSVGMRARVVTGFQVTEYNDVAGFYLVRQKNAHAWVEVWGVGGWQTYDPSPPGSIEELHRPDDGLFAAARRWYDFLEYQWVNNVITFDKTQQGGMIERAKALASSLGASLVALLVSQTWINPTLLVGIVGLIGILAMIHRHRRRWAGVLSTEGMSGQKRKQLQRDLWFYAEAVRLLRRAGWRRQEAQTPGAFAVALVDQDPARFGSVGALTDLYYQIRYGGRPLDDARRAEAERLLQDLSTRL